MLNPSLGMKIFYILPNYIIWYTVNDLIMYCNSPLDSIAFNQSTYSINEDDGVVVCTLVLTQPLSTDAIINIIDFEGSALGE